MQRYCSGTGSVQHKRHRSRIFKLQTSLQEKKYLRLVFQPSSISAHNAATTNNSQASSCVHSLLLSHVAIMRCCLYLHGTAARIHVAVFLYKCPSL